VDEHLPLASGDHPMKSTLLLVFATLAFGVCPNVVLACTAPSQGGAVICFPSNKAIVTYPMTIEGAAAGDNGLLITKMILYSNNKKVMEQDKGGEMVVYDPQDEFNQSYHFVLNAWDSDGNLYQASTYVTQIDGVYPTNACTHPAEGINFCSPPSGSYQPNGFVQIVASASSGVTSINAWLNGHLQSDESGNQYVEYSTSTVNNAWQTFTVKAYEGSQNVATATSKYKLYYSCLGFNSTCNEPYINIQQPGNYADENSPFTVQAQVQGNTEPITGTKVYLDNNVVATSTGATIVASVTASAGTHLLTVQSWDITGTLYKTQHTVNVY
jgi:hypothetical protein